MVNRCAAAAVAAASAGALWHIGPAATWLPPVRERFAPGLDGRGSPGHIALTFDDGPDSGTTPRFLDALDRLGVRATFFVLGERLLDDRGLARGMLDAGHELGVHGWSHEKPWFPEPHREAADLARTAGTISDLGAAPPTWYRPPYGILTAGRRRAAARARLRPVLWTAWGRDWRPAADRRSVLADLSRRLTGGATVLLHDSDYTSAPGSWRTTLDALPDLVSWCRAAGWRVGTLGEHGVERAGTAVRETAVGEERDLGTP
ncbi:polysaccharide deacetylase family protein [Streptomyces xiaopingdaonensis]|uniref:polysaccharide deacetylase family protein n=1 Tax=Streptomyces xiaopingdaonensis TaxID=1565415 RepID=UPI001872DC1E|nr:polysaccharide deacetylase family protein [Streptomyces xiaopingdaonensis]